MPTPHPGDPTGIPTPYLRALSALWAIPLLSRRVLRPAEPFGAPKAHPAKPFGIQKPDSAEPSPVSVPMHRSGHPVKRPGRTNCGPGSKDRIPQPHLRFQESGRWSRRFFRDSGHPETPPESENRTGTHKAHPARPWGMPKRHPATSSGIQKPHPATSSGTHKPRISCYPR